jgi:hypothetical protein
LEVNIQKGHSTLSILAMAHYNDDLTNVNEAEAVGSNITI